MTCSNVTQDFLAWDLWIFAFRAGIKLAKICEWHWKIKLHLVKIVDPMRWIILIMIIKMILKRRRMPVFHFRASNTTTFILMHSMHSILTRAANDENLHHFITTLAFENMFFAIIICWSHLRPKYFKAVLFIFDNLFPDFIYFQSSQGAFIIIFSCLVHKTNLVNCKWIQTSSDNSHFVSFWKTDFIGSNLVKLFRFSF